MNIKYYLMTKAEKNVSVINRITIKNYDKMTLSVFNLVNRENITSI